MLYQDEPRNLSIMLTALLMISAHFSCEIMSVHPVPEKGRSCEASGRGGRNGAHFARSFCPSVPSAPTIRRTAFRASSNRRRTERERDRDRDRPTDQLNNCRLSGNHLRPRSGSPGWQCQIRSEALRKARSLLGILRWGIA